MIDSEISRNHLLLTGSGVALLIGTADAVWKILKSRDNLLSKSWNL